MGEVSLEVTLPENKMRKTVETMALLSIAVWIGNKFPRTKPPTEKS